MGCCVLGAIIISQGLMFYRRLKASLRWSPFVAVGIGAALLLVGLYQDHLGPNHSAPSLDGILCVGEQAQSSEAAVIPPFANRDQRDGRPLP